MKFNNLKLQFALSLLLILPFQIKGAEARDLFANDTEVDEISKTDKPLVFTDETYRDLDGTTPEVLPDKKISFQYLANRRTLTGRQCAINKIVNTVDVGSGQKDLDKVVNDDLNDYGEFISTVSVGVTYNPLLSVKDNSCYYAKGTMAGYCIVSGSGNTVLSLDVISALSISFYRDGKLVKTVAVQEGQSGSGVNLKLVNIPGSDGSSICLSAIAPCVFDEISLDLNGGVNVGVGKLYRIKYAFVGDAREFTITENKKNGSIPTNGELSPFQKYNLEENQFVNLDYVKGFNPVLLGIPFGISKNEMKRFTNEDYDDYVALTPVLGLLYMGGTKFMMKDTGNSKREVYKAGTEVGFSYTHASALKLGLGNTIEIILFDRNGNEVQSEKLGTEVLGLSVGKGGRGNSCITSKVPFSGAEIRFWGALEVNLGGLGVHYAFVREQPEVRHNCPINPSADISLCAEQDSYQLLSNPDIPVKWTFEKFIPYYEDEEDTPSVKVTESGYVTGLDLPGQYIFRATAADGCSETVSIFFDMFPKPSEIKTQGTPLANGKDYEGEYEISKYRDGQTSGGLLIIDNLKDPENVLDGEFDEETQQSGLNKFAQYGGLQLAGDQMVIGLKRTDADIINFDRDSQKEGYEKGSRVGFVVSSTVTGLNLSVLNFWNIRCLKDGVEVYRKVVDESNAISAGLGGTDGNKQTRYAITVPWYDNKNNRIEVDEIQLWTSGVLDLSGQQLNIYYGFVEGEAENGGDPLKYSATVVSTETTGATIDYSLFGNASLVQALGAMDNISYFIDNDPKMETALVENHTAGVAARVIIPVNLGRTVDFRNTIGLVMRSDSYLANVKLGSGMTIYTMYRGVKTGDSFSNWGILGADVAGYGDKQIFYIHPTRICDEVVIDYGDGVTLESPKFFGLFLVTDSDADGIPDSQDPNSCVSTVKDIQPGSVCEGTELVIDATGIPGNTYLVQFNDPSVIEYFETEILEIKADEVTTNNIHLSYPTKTPGQYQLTFYNAEGTPISSSVYYVHPLTTEWRRNAASSDWTNWTNWTKGTPYCCSNVIIPSDARNYPILSQDNPIGDEFCANYIFIRPGAFIGSVNKLNYKRAWVQMELSPNCYNLLTAPLKGMVTGDMFIPAVKEGVDEPEEMFTFNPSEENRFNPTIYQRLWFSSAQDRTPANTLKELGDLEEIDGMTFTKWSRNFNHLNTPYKLGMGYSMWVDNGKLPENTKFRFTFPKENTEYRYFDDFTQMPVNPEIKEILTREGEAGRFIYESETPSKTLVYNNNGVDETRGLYDVPASADITAEDHTDHFLFGNPFMSPINAREFIRTNTEVIKGIRSYDGNVASSLVFDDEKGEFMTTGDIEEIAPMTAVFLIAREKDQSDMTVSLDEDMIDANYSIVDESETAQGIRVRASAGNLSSSMFALTESDIQNYALFDNEVAPKLAIFSNVDGEACDIVPPTEDVSLTLIADANAEVTIDFLTYDVNRDDWKLVDLATDKEYPLDHAVVLPAGTGTSSGRFHLVKNQDVVTGIENPMENQGDVYVVVDGNNIVATATTGNLNSMEVFDLSGSNIVSLKAAQPVITAGVDGGIYVVRVSSERGVTSHKIIVR